MFVEQKSFFFKEVRFHDFSRQQCADNPAPGGLGGELRREYWVEPACEFNPSLACLRTASHTRALVQVRVRRIYDKERATLAYVSYSTKLLTDEQELSAGRFRTSVDVLTLGPEDAAIVSGVAAPAS